MWPETLNSKHVPLLWGQHPQRYPKCKFWDVPSSVPWWLVSRQDDQGTLCGDSTGFVQSGVLILQLSMMMMTTTTTTTTLSANHHWRTTRSQPSLLCRVRLFDPDAYNKAQRVESSIWVSRNCCILSGKRTIWIHLIQKRFQQRYERCSMMFGGL